MRRDAMVFWLGTVLSAILPLTSARGDGGMFVIQTEEVGTAAKVAASPTTAP